MDVYRAIANFTAPQFNSLGKPIHTCLSFKKGDLFEVLESENERTKTKVWWACRRTSEERSIGYVPSKYLKFHEKRSTRLKEDSSPSHHAFRVETEVRSQRDAREIHVRALADLRQHAGEAPPNDVPVHDPVLSPMSPTAPMPAGPPLSPARPYHRKSPGNSTPNATKLSPGAIRVPFMTPMLPGSPGVVGATESPPGSPRNSSCNQCGTHRQNPRHDVIDLSTAFPAWNPGQGGRRDDGDIQKAEKTTSASPARCFHRPVGPSKSAGLINNGHQPSSPANGSPVRKAPVYPPGSPESRRNREGLIEPKKLVNPCMESKERQVLHRELLQISQTQGEMVAMLPKKSELRRVS